MRSLSDVFQDIVSNLQDIIRSEVRLAKTELRSDLDKTRDAALTLGLGLMAGLLAVLFLLLAAVAALSLVMPVWEASLLVAACLALVTLLLVAIGIKKVRGLNPMPKTRRAIEENITWTRQPQK